MVPANGISVTATAHRVAISVGWECYRATRIRYYIVSAFAQGVDDSSAGGAAIMAIMKEWNWKTIGLWACHCYLTMCYLPLLPYPDFGRQVFFIRAMMCGLVRST